VSFIVGQQEEKHMSEEEISEWGVFYKTLNRLGPRLLEGLHPDLEEWVALQAADSDEFWSIWLHGDFDLWEEGDRVNAVRKAFEDWVYNRQYQGLWCTIFTSSLIEAGRCLCQAMRKSPSGPGVYDR
jgi:hypothetical protein